MTILERIEQWNYQSQITPEQSTRLVTLVKQEPFSVFLELNFLLYAGVLAFVAGLGWSLATLSARLGDIAVLLLLTALLAACFYFCFTRAPAYAPTQTTAPTPILDYVLYLGTLIWGLELAFIEARFGLLAGQWDIYLLVSALFFFFLAYRFDNRFVLSLALSSLAGWFGFSLSLRFPDGYSDATVYRPLAIAYCALVGVSAGFLRSLKIKAHFFNTYLNLIANVLFIALLSGVFNPEATSGLWFIALLLACAASIIWGLEQKHFAFVAYAVVYGYIGISDLLVRNSHDYTSVLAYFIVSGIAVVIALVVISRSLGRPA